MIATLLRFMYHYLLSGDRVPSVLSLKNVQRFNNRGDTLQWAASVSLPPQHVQAVEDQSTREIVSKSVRT